MKIIPWALGAIGVAMALYATVGRFVGGRMVLSWALPGGMAAGSVLLAANTVLLLAVLVALLAPKPKE